MVFCTVTRAFCYPFSKKSKKKKERYAQKDDPREIKKRITRVLLIINSPGYVGIITMIIARMIECNVCVRIARLLAKSLHKCKHYYSHINITNVICATCNARPWNQTRWVFLWRRAETQRDLSECESVPCISCVSPSPINFDKSERVLNFICMIDSSLNDLYRARRLQGTKSPNRRHAVPLRWCQNFECMRVRTTDDINGIVLAKMIASVALGVIQP